MSFLIGLVCLVFAAGFVMNARAHKARALAAAERRKAAGGDGAAPKLHPSLEIMADVGPAFVNLFLVGAAVMTVGAFVSIQPIPWFSWVDLGGFLAFLAAYGYWITTRSEHRLVDE